MIIPINLSFPINKNFKKTTSYTTNFIINTNVINTYDGIYNEDNGKYYISEASPEEGDDICDVYKFRYGDGIIVTINGTPEYIKPGRNIKNMLMALKKPIKFVINWTMKKNGCIGNIENVKPAMHKPKNLERVQQIPTDPFVTIKMNGITVLCAFLKHFGIQVVDLQDNVIFSDESYKHYTNEVFGGEYIDNKVYLFMEINENNRDFRIDYHNMTRAIEAYNNEDLITLNIIEIAAPGENFRIITRRLMEHRADMESNGIHIKSDGLIYGSISTKLHYKWKPPEANTVDFYVIHRHGKLHLYIGKLRRRVKRRQTYRNLPLIIGDGEYVSAYYKTIPVNDPSFDDKIVEFQYIRRRWIPYKIRPDKVVPNNIRTLLSTLKSLEHPINISNLI